ncbi:hypothetical protein AAMO2058_001073000 [Amorphochlora amoebiformis]
MSGSKKVGNFRGGCVRNSTSDRQDMPLGGNGSEGKKCWDSLDYRRFELLDIEEDERASDMVNGRKVVGKLDINLASSPIPSIGARVRVLFHDEDNQHITNWDPGTIVDVSCIDRNGYPLPPGRLRMWIQYDLTDEIEECLYPDSGIKILPRLGTSTPNETIWTNYYLSGLLPWEDGYVPALLSQWWESAERERLLVGKLRCADLGCGTGLSTVFLAKECQKINPLSAVYGVDNESHALVRGRDRAAAHNLTIDFVHDDIIQFSKTSQGGFDFAWDRYCLENIQPHSSVVLAIAHILKPGGLLLTVYHRPIGNLTRIEGSGVRDYIEKWTQEGYFSKRWARPSGAGSDENWWSLLERTNKTLPSGLASEN